MHNMEPMAHLSSQMDRTACLGPIPRIPSDPTAEMADIGGAAATEGTVELVRMRLHRPVGMNLEGVGMVVTVARAADSEDKAVMEAAGPATRKVPTPMVPMVGTEGVVIPAVEMAAGVGKDNQDSPEWEGMVAKADLVGMSLMPAPMPVMGVWVVVAVTEATAVIRWAGVAAMQASGEMAA